MRRRPARAAAVVAAFSLAAACAGCGHGSADGTGGERAVDVSGRWHRASPEQVGLGPRLLAEVDRRVRKEFHGLEALLVVRHGRLAFERYYGGRDRPHDVYSVTKTVVSLLIGIALGEGSIRSVDQTLADFLPEARSSAVDPRVRAITLRQLLEMRAGLTATSDYLLPRDALRLSLTCDPGTCFIYNEVASHLLSTVLTRATGTSAADFAGTRLFKPLGIGASRWSWSADAAGNSFGGTGLALLARDMAKIGYFLLRGGRWGGHQIVPAGYIRAATKVRVHTPEPHGLSYGYQTWIAPDAFFALGFGGQSISVFPKRDLVVVTKGAFENGDMESLIGDVVRALRD